MADSMIKFGKGRGRLAVAARKWAESLEVDGIVPGSAAVRVELARDVANLADGARSAGDVDRYLRAVPVLRQLMADAERAVRGDRGSGAGGDGGDDGAELAELLGAGPAVGDSADS